MKWEASGPISEHAEPSVQADINKHCRGLTTVELQCHAIVPIFHYPMGS